MHTHTPPKSRLSAQDLSGPCGSHATKSEESLERTGFKNLKEGINWQDKQEKVHTVGDVFWEKSRKRKILRKKEQHMPKITSL